MDKFPFCDWIRTNFVFRKGRERIFLLIFQLLSTRVTLRRYENELKKIESVKNGLRFLLRLAVRIGHFLRNKTRVYIYIYFCTTVKMHFATRVRSVTARNAQTFFSFFYLIIDSTTSTRRQSFRGVRSGAVVPRCNERRETFFPDDK